MGIPNPPPEPIPVMPPWRDVAKSAYAAYTACLDGQWLVMPWEKLPAEYKAAWEAAVRQAANVLRAGAGEIGIEQRWEGWTPFPSSTECN